MFRSTLSTISQVTGLMFIAKLASWGWVFLLGVVLYGALIPFVVPILLIINFVQLRKVSLWRRYFLPFACRNPHLTLPETKSADIRKQM